MIGRLSTATPEILHYIASEDKDTKIGTDQWHCQANRQDSGTDSQNKFGKV